MKESKPIYVAFSSDDDFQAIVWETEKGRIITTKGSINPETNIVIKDVRNCEVIKDVDIRNLLMEILP